MTGSRHCSRAATAAVLFLLVLHTAPSHALDFAGGTGEPNDPYQIATAEQLLAMDDDPNLCDKHFALVADLDLDPALPGREVFAGPLLRQWVFPSGLRGRGVPFEGTLHGNGHTIHNSVFHIPRGSGGSGVFQAVGKSGRICDLHLRDVLIVDDMGEGLYCGALVGQNAGFVANCSVTGTIVTGVEASAYHPSRGGGLIDYNAGIVVDCHSQCYIVGEQVGGLAGTNGETGRVVFCSTNGLVLGGGTSGGLVGTNAGLIQYSFAEGGNLVGSNSGIVRESYASGFGTWSSLVSTNTGTVANCYVTGTALVDSYRSLPGGLVGTNKGTIVSSCSSRSIEKPGAVPEPLPLVGNAEYADDVRQSYYLATEKPAGITHGEHYWLSGVPLLAEEMQQQASFPGLDFVGDPNDGTQDHWFMAESGAPILVWQAGIPELAGIPDISGLELESARQFLTWMGFVPGVISYDYARAQEVCDGRDCQWVSTEGQALYTCPGTYAAPGSSLEIVVSLGPYDFNSNPGDGSESNPYQIATAGQLDALHDRPDLWAGHFILTADLDLTNQTYPLALIRAFSGTFDGNGHAIRYHGRHGLFETIEPNAVVCNLALDSALISAIPEAGYLGILAGRNGGQIIHCGARGRLFAGEDTIGGLVGCNEGKISHCTFSGQILSGYWQIGGLVGYNTGQIANSEVRAQIQAAVDSVTVGGLAGQNDRSIVACSVRESSVRGGRSVGGLAGLNHGYQTRIQDSYAQGIVQGEINVGGLVGLHQLEDFRRSRSIVTPDETTVVILNCYSACSVTGQDEVGGFAGYAYPNLPEEACHFLGLDGAGGPDNGYGTALSAEEMRREASFVGWDFENTWIICEGVDSPRLQWEDVVCEP